MCVYTNVLLQILVLVCVCVYTNVLPQILVLVCVCVHKCSAADNGVSVCVCVYDTDETKNEFEKTVVTCTINLLSLKIANSRYTGFVSIFRRKREFSISLCNG